MSVRLRLKRMGNRHRPFYRVTAVDQRRKRDGKVIEQLGWFNPLEKDEAKQSELNTDRCAYWLSVGAQPSQTVAMLLKRQGLEAASGTKVADQPKSTGSE
ncbi:MAG: 30S ribosomal protein S16 [Phycisphaeraceae bacterium]|nr:30S ribosomal protein S16 [Phycisphaeraceae bacterium]